MAKDRSLTRGAVAIMSAEIFLTGLPTFMAWNATTTTGKISAFISGAVLLLLLPLFAVFLFDMARNRRNRRTIVIVAFMIVNVCDAIVLFANIYKSIGVVNLAPSPYPLFDAIYFSTVTWTTLGYGDITPSIHARPVAAIEALCGYFVMGLLISIVVIMAQSEKPNTGGP